MFRSKLRWIGFDSYYRSNIEYMQQSKCVDWDHARSLSLSPVFFHTGTTLLKKIPLIRGRCGNGDGGGGRGGWRKKKGSDMVRCFFFRLGEGGNNV